MRRLRQRMGKDGLLKDLHWVSDMAGLGGLMPWSSVGQLY